MYQSFSDVGLVLLSPGWVLSEISELGHEQESQLLPLQQTPWQPGLRFLMVYVSGSARSVERLTKAQDLSGLGSQLLGDEC